MMYHLKIKAPWATGCLLGLILGGPVALASPEVYEANDGDAIQLEMSAKPVNLGDMGAPEAPRTAPLRRPQAKVAPSTAKSKSGPPKNSPRPSEPAPKKVGKGSHGTPPPEGVQLRQLRKYRLQVRALESQVVRLKRQLAAKSIPPQVPATSFSTEGLRGHFDNVPEDQIEGVIRRLETVRILIQKYGRAYDYRIHTNKDLETYLDKLDTKRLLEE